MTVHWTQPNFEAMSETDGHGDTCGPIAILDYLHLARGYALDVATVDSLRSLYIAHGYMNTASYRGMTITSIAAALETLHHITPVAVVPWDQINIDEFHTTIKNIYQSHDYVIYETHNASALPGNQPNVQNHYIGIWGEDSSAGYYCANGDTMYALTHGGIVQPVWYTWSNILASVPKGYVVLHAI